MNTPYTTSFDSTAIIQANKQRYIQGCCDTCADVLKYIDSQMDSLSKQIENINKKKTSEDFANSFPPEFIKEMQILTDKLEFYLNGLNRVKAYVTIYKDGIEHGKA